MNIQPDDEKQLQHALLAGEIVLLLGAGASARSLKENGEEILFASGLAKVIAEASGFTYAGESLTEVLGASVGQKISQVQLNRILTTQFTKISPTAELSQLMDYTWRRVYTWNIDDAVENIRGGVQRRRFFNGMIDKAVAHEGQDYLQVVHLHGEALKPEHGFIFTANEYNSRLNRDVHDWYREAAADYAAYTPVFIGSRLNEPILSAELDRARPLTNHGLGRAFLVCPDAFTQVQLASFAARNIAVLTGELKDLVDWLAAKVAKRISPRDVGKNTSDFVRSLTDIDALSDTDIETGKDIQVRTWAETKKRAGLWAPNELERIGRGYLEGMPPTWRLATTDVPVFLHATERLYTHFREAIKRRDRVFLVHGQSGSGKTTAILQCMLRYLREHPEAVVYELSNDLPSLRQALELIHKVNRDKHVVIYIGDAFMFGDSLAEDVLARQAGEMTIITSARSGEWTSHIRRRLGDMCTAFEFQRFVEPDYAPLIDRLLQYVPAPAFRKLPEGQRIDRVKAAKFQLLIALREATQSERFTQVITNEFNALPDEDCRTLLLIAALSTLSRSGISIGMAREAFARVQKRRSFDAALAALDGIVGIGSKDRLIARHELYVRHIIENVANYAEVIDATIEVLRCFTKFRLPIVKTVGRQDSLLFKFLLNHNFLKEIGTRRAERLQALRVYETFEIAFQLDGHFWLQYGLFLGGLGEHSRSLSALSKSIQAYPDNMFALHAFADAQLRVAFDHPEYDAVTKKLIGDAVSSLEVLNARNEAEADHYPLVTLAYRHVGALVKHGQLEAAREAAQGYFKQLEQRTKRESNEQLEGARQRLAHFLTSGRWAVDSTASRHRRFVEQRP